MPQWSRRSALRVGGIAVVTAVAGCLSSESSSDDGSPAPSTTQSSPETGTTTTASESETTGVGSPHPLDVSIVNEAETAHTVTLQFRADGDESLTEEVELDSGARTTVDEAVPVPETGSVEYTGTATLGDGTTRSQTYTMDTIHDLHELTVTVTASGDIQWGRVIH